MDWQDIFIIAGILLIGVALWLSLGVPAAVAYAGVLMVLAGIFAGVRK